MKRLEHHVGNVQPNGENCPAQGITTSHGVTIAHRCAMGQFGHRPPHTCRVCDFTWEDEHRESPRLLGGLIIEPADLGEPCEVCLHPACIKLRGDYSEDYTKLCREHASLLVSGLARRLGGDWT